MVIIEKKIIYIEKMEEQLFNNLRNNIKEDNQYYLDNKDNITCHNCKKLNIQAKICKRCDFSFCYFCQKNHRCHCKRNYNNTNSWEIDIFTRNCIKKIVFICKKCKIEINYERAKNHFQLCSKEMLNSNRITLYNNFTDVSIAESKEKIKNRKQNDSNKEKKFCFCCNCNMCCCNYCYSCNCNQCQCIACNALCNKCEKDNDNCEICDNIKNCFKCLFKENGGTLLFINLTLKFVLGCVYAGIILGNLPSGNDFINKGSFPELEKDKMKKMSNQDESLAIIELFFCLFGGFLGYFLICYFHSELFGILLIVLPDIIFGDLASTICIANHRKTIINNLTTYPNQQLIQILYESYNKIYSVQWIIFAIKMVLLLFSVINYFCLK